MDIQAQALWQKQGEADAMLEGRCDLESGVVHGLLARLGSEGPIETASDARNAMGWLVCFPLEEEFGDGRRWLRYVPSLAR